MNYDEAFFQIVLEKEYRDSLVKVQSVDGVDGSEELGDYNLSDIIRVRVKFTRSLPSECGTCNSSINGTRNFVVKYEPGKISPILKLIQDEKFFTVEHRVLREVLPRIESALRVRLGPKLVYGTDEPPRTIVMEDLIPQGFCMKDKQQGLSMQHANMAIQNLARFHAGSVLLLEENPEALRSFKQGFFNTNTPPIMFPLIVNFLNRLCKDAMIWSDGGLRYQLAAKKLMAIISSVEDRILDVYKYEDNEFCVLNHGDAWINNMMFREDEAGNPIEQVFVDYQMVRYSSPGVDLLYFLSLNPALEVRGDGEEALLETYLNTLSSSMGKLKCKTEPPTMGHLKESMYRRRIYAVISSLFLLPQVLWEKKDFESMAQLLQNGTFINNPYETPRTIRMMKRLLPLLNDRGYLDPVTF